MGSDDNGKTSFQDRSLTRVVVICLIGAVVVYGSLRANASSSDPPSVVLAKAAGAVTLRTKSTTSPQQQERACIAHLLCRGCATATDFQKQPPDDIENSCSSLLNALITAEVNQTTQLCISDAFCSGTSPLQEALSTGSFSFPSTTKRIWIDAGADWTTFYSRCQWPQLQWPRGLTCNEFKKSDDISAVSIDANTQYFSKLSKLDRVTPISSAVGLENTAVVFKHYRGPGCSSANEPNLKAGASVPSACKVVDSREVVPMLRLELLLDLIPLDLQLEFLKIDVQGYDLKAAQSLGRHLHRVSKIYIEAQEDGQVPLTEGQPSKSQVIEWFESVGFVYNEKQSAVENPAIGEWNLMFDNNIK